MGCPYEKCVGPECGIYSQGCLGADPKFGSKGIIPYSGKGIAKNNPGHEVGHQSVGADSRAKSAIRPVQRVNDFWLIETSLSPKAFLDFMNSDVLGHYDVLDNPEASEFGLICLQHAQGAGRPGSLEGGTIGPLALAKSTVMILAKLDLGPWDWYETASTAFLIAVVTKLGAKAWRCGWSLDKQWSWIEAWRPHRKTGKATMTETIDGPANAEVTRKALERWKIDVRSAFDQMMLAAQFEALRRWLALPEPRPLPSIQYVSRLAGKLLIQKGDEGWIPKHWEEHFPGRSPAGDPLHLQGYYKAMGAPGRNVRIGYNPQKQTSLADAADQARALPGPTEP